MSFTSVPLSHAPQIVEALLQSGLHTSIMSLLLTNVGFGMVGYSYFINRIVCITYYKMFRMKHTYLCVINESALYFRGLVCPDCIQKHVLKLILVSANIGV